ncbi:MAG: hypothetical protein ILA34_01920 [Bacteroidaceae bacterium]|nr:hypothetical protein [Bacteroidaceae bacterium]
MNTVISGACFCAVWVAVRLRGLKGGQRGVSDVPMRLEKILLGRESGSNKAQKTGQKPWADS